MKKLFLLAVVALISVTSFAQDGKWAAGVNIGYGSDISKPSIGVKALYDINNSFTVAPSFNYYFQKKDEGVKMNYWDLNCDLHWNVVSKENFKFYPLAGITYLHGKASFEGESGSDSWFGANIGVGGQFNLSSNWAAAVEAKYQIIDGSQFVPSLSLMYRF
ncbi:outer membrane beta-barrel protein [Bacteroidaceae bacterium]|jgi:opacity protein-like surface antigen